MSFPQPRFWTKLERHPLSAEYEDIEGDIFEKLVAGVKEFGVIDRSIIMFEDQVLDGWQLLRACIEAKVKPTFKPLPRGMSAEKFVELKNDLRRQSEEEQTLKRIAARQERVAKARDAGKSFRTIADEEGVSPKTVQRDLEEKSAGVAGGATGESDAEKKPKKVTGKDGKTYSAAKPKLLCPRCTRVGESKDCVACHELRQKAEKKPKSGKIAFDEKKFDAAYGALTRVIDQRGNALGKGKYHEQCQRCLQDFLDKYKLWKKETE